MVKIQDLCIEKFGDIPAAGLLILAANDGRVHYQHTGSQYEHCLSLGAGIGLMCMDIAKRSKMPVELVAATILAAIGGHVGEAIDEKKNRG